MNGDQLLAGTDGSGVFIYNNSWTPINKGIAAAEITSFVKKDNNLYAGIKGGGVFLSTDDGSNWIEKNTGLTNLEIQALTVKGSNIFAGTNGGGIYRSGDNGSTWQTVNSGIFQKYIYSLAANDNYIFAGTNLPPDYPQNTVINNPWPDSVLIYRSSDDGNNWSVVSDSGAYRISFIYTIDSTIYAAPWKRLLRSTDNGTTWSLSDSGLAVRQYSTITIPLLPYTFFANGNKLFAGTTNGIYVSTNMGVIWQHINDSRLGLIHSLTSGNNYVFAYNSQLTLDGFAISWGVYFSQDNGTSWNLLEDSLNEHNTQGPFAPEINTMVVNNNYLFIGTKGKGVWKYPLENLVSVQNSNNKQPNSYKLFQNYPNPFNPTTTISYNLKKNIFVSLIIYDALGRKVVTLVNQYQNQGNHKVVLDAKNLSSGIYFYRLSTGDFTETKKLILIK